MGWFNEKLDDQAKSLVADLTSAYCERARLAFRLLSLEPQLTAMQMAVCWAGVVLTMESARELETQRTGKMALWHSTAREFFDTLCQDYVSMQGSSLELKVSSTVIQENISSTIQGMSLAFRTTAGSLVAELGGNATDLAGATITFLSAGFTRDQRKAAEKYAATVLASQKNLNAFEREKVREWMAGLDWSR